MDKEKQKEQFQIAYVCALAAHAGLNTSTITVDDDSVDVVIIGKGYPGKIRNPQIQLQLKCQAMNGGRTNGTELKYRLKRKNYDDLRGDNLVSPRILAVLLVPHESNAWIEHKKEGMILRHLCYWKSIRTYPDTSQKSVTIGIPVVQRLTTQTLLELMKSASDGVKP